LPEGYESWASYIDESKQLSGLISLPTFHAAYKLLGNLGLVFMVIAVSAAILTGIVGFYMASSRLLYSMSRENVLPAWFGKLHERYKTPRNAILFVLAISCIAPFFGRVALGWIVDMSSIGATIGYGYTSFAAAKFAIQRKHKTIVITGIFGVIISLIFAVILLVPIPGTSASLGVQSYICLAVWIALGVILKRLKVK